MLRRRMRFARGSERFDGSAPSCDRGHAIKSSGCQLRKTKTACIACPASSRMFLESSRNGCGGRFLVYLDLVTALRAHVVNGRIVVDEPVDLPDGAEVRVYLYDAAADGMSKEE